MPYKPPNNITVKPPVSHDGSRGYILARALDAHGRPVSFAYAGDPAEADGASLTLRAPLLKKSLNFKLLAKGNAYPLFYDTLFASLRDTLAQATAAARTSEAGLWKKDKTTAGLAVSDESTLEATGVVFPKLFRRLTSYFDGGGTGLEGFLPWLEATKEQVLDLTSGNFTHLDDMLKAKIGKLRMTVRPEQLVIVSAKTTNTKIAPGWLTRLSASPASSLRTGWALPRRRNVGLSVVPTRLRAKRSRWPFVPRGPGGDPNARALMRPESRQRELARRVGP